VVHPAISKSVIDAGVLFEQTLTAAEPKELANCVLYVVAEVVAGLSKYE
jgi:hypothetical protein